MTVLDPPITPIALTTGIAASAVGVSKVYGKGDTEVRALDNVDVDFVRRATSPPSWARPDPASPR